MFVREAIVSTKKLTILKRHDLTVHTYRILYYQHPLTNGTKQNKTLQASKRADQVKCNFFSLRSSKTGGSGCGGGGGGAAGLPRALDLRRTNSYDAINTGCKGFVRSRVWMESSELKEEAEDGDHLSVVLNFLLDIPPPLTYIPHTVPVQVMMMMTVELVIHHTRNRTYHICSHRS